MSLYSLMDECDVQWHDSPSCIRLSLWIKQITLDPLTTCSRLSGCGQRLDADGTTSMSDTGSTNKRFGV